MINIWHADSIAEVGRKLNSSEKGLSENEAKRRLEFYGMNSLPVKHPPTAIQIFFNQFKSPLIYALLVAALTVALLKEYVDAIIILAVLFLNAIVGAYQEGKAEDTLAALRNLTDTDTVVLRDGVEKIILDKLLVPGDVVVLGEGDRVPADARILWSTLLRVNESTLTGEVTPVKKNDDVVRAEAVLGDRTNMVYKGTFVVGGVAKVLVVSTGIETEVGKISEALVKLDSDVPLKRNIRKMSNIIIVAVGLISFFIFFAGIATGESVSVMFSTVVALAVSAIPEGLPVVVTLVLATGVWRMSKKHVLVKKLQAVEALGQAQVIAVDKTGTVTRNEMSVQKIYTALGIYNVDGEGYEAKGEIKFGDKTIDALNHVDVVAAAKISALTSTARVSLLADNLGYKVNGDPTEAALLVFAEKVGFHRHELENETPKIFEIPFDSDYKFHAVINTTGDQNTLSMIGAPESILPLCTKILVGDKIETMTIDIRAEIEKMVSGFAEDGLRVLAAGMKVVTDDTLSVDAPPTLVFVSLYGISDVIRKEVSDALSRARSAGVRVVMITGDHEVTASAIARKVGILTDGGQVLSGKEISEMTKEELAIRIDNVSVFTRVSPQDKLKIIDAFRSRGIIVAMTGDGVNDALSLVAADLGVSMGVIGTEVSKDAADIVLLTDDFGGIVSAIEEGRNIYKSIQRVILYLLSTNTGEVLVIVAAILMGLHVPLEPSQIIWLNMVTDGFLVVALAMEPRDSKILTDTHRTKSLIDKFMTFRILLIGATMMLVTLFLFIGYLPQGIEKASTVALVTLAMLQWFNALNVRSRRRSIFPLRLRNNYYLIGAFLAVIALQIMAVHTSFMQSILHTVPLKLSEWLVIITFSVSVLLVEEIRKLLARLMD